MFHLLSVLQIKSFVFDFEHKRKPLLSADKFYRRLLFNLLLAIVVILVSLSIGIWGYMSLAQLKFADAILNASMILGGMGPVDPMPNETSKYFASFYALFSGISFISTMAVLLAPVVHRAMHKFHLETDEDEEKK